MHVPLPQNGPHDTVHLHLPCTGHIPLSNPSNMAAQIPGHPVRHQQQNVPLFANVEEGLQITEPVSISQSSGTSDANHLIVQPVNQTFLVYILHRLIGAISHYISLLFRL